MPFLPISYDETIPAFVPADTIPASLIKDIPIGHVLYVQYGSMVATPTGSIIAPYPNLSAAYTYIATQPIGTVWTIYTNPGTEPSPVIVPAGYTITVVGSAPQTTTIPNITVTAQGGMMTPTIHVLYHADPGTITVADGMSPGTATITVLNSQLGSIGMAMGSTSTVNVQLAAPYPAFSPMYRPVIVTGPISITGDLSATNMQLNGNISAASLSVAFSSLPQNISLSTATGALINSSSFPISLSTITFTGAAGTATFDPPSTLSFDIALGSIVNGTKINSNGLQIAYRTYVGAPPQIGEIFHFTSGPVGQIERAGAGDDPLMHVVGVYNGSPNTLLTTPGVNTFVYFEPGLSLSNDDIFYLSGFTDGAATNIEPAYGNFSVRLGYIYDASSYNSLTGGIVSCIWLPSYPKEHRQYPITIASLAPGGIWYPNEYVGPTCGTTSNSSLTGFGSGVGFYLVTETGFLSGFRYMNATPVFSSFQADLYLAPGGNPSLFSYTGSSAFIMGGDYTSFTPTDLIPVNAGDILVFFNPSLSIGYTPDALTISSTFISAE